MILYSLVCSVTQFIRVRAMDGWKIDAIVSLEHELQTSLSLTGLIPLLEKPAGGFMTWIDRMSVEALEGRLKRVGRIIEVLRKKGNQEFDAFIEILRRSGNETWATEIEEKAEQFRQKYETQGIQDDSPILIPLHIIWHGMACN